MKSGFSSTKGNVALKSLWQKWWEVGGAKINKAEQIKTLCQPVCDPKAVGSCNI